MTPEQKAFITELSDTSQMYCMYYYHIALVSMYNEVWLCNLPANVDIRTEIVESQTLQCVDNTSDYNSIG